jgi:uncharacterized protein
MLSLRHLTFSSMLLFGGWLSGADISGVKRLEQGLEGVSVTIPHALQYDFVSRLNGRSYRLMISVPAKDNPKKSYPVLYLLDGNYHFAAAANGAVYTAANQATAPAIVVGIGYPTDDFIDIREKRVLDLTPSVSPGDEHRTGGGDTFLRVLLEEIKPFVASRYRIDDTREAIFGKSIGGLMVLRLLFRNPTTFDTYIAANPSIWWQNQEVLQDEETFSSRVNKDNLRLRILMTSAAEEQYRGSDPTRLQEAKKFSMVDNASALATRLTRLNSANLEFVYVVFPEEDHVSVSLATIGRTLKFALRADD